MNRTMPRPFLSVVSLILPAFTAGSYWSFHAVDLIKFPNARCLDGTPGGFWIQKPLTDHPLKNNQDGNKYLIHHQGGGWCINDADCYYRSPSYLGSSRNFTDQDCDNGEYPHGPCYEAGMGLYSTNPVINPDFYDWTKIFLGYCDGASFSGNVLEPITYQDGNQTVYLHYKGKYILDAIHQTLIEEYGVVSKSDTEIIFTGTSAGALAVIIHADYLSDHYRSAAPTNQTLRISVASDAGFFMDLPSITGEMSLFAPT